MAEQDQATKQGANSGSFKPGQSGNRKGRPQKAKPAQRRDGWINTSSGHGTSRDRRTLTRYGVDIVTDIEALQLWRSEFLAARIIEALPEEAFRRGWSLKLEDKDLAEEVCGLAEELGLDEQFVLAAQYERAYGGSAIFPVMSGALGDLKEPLDEGAIASVDALHVLEPQELTPVDYYKDLGSPKFGRPETYRLMPLTSGRVGSWSTQIVHESRLIIFPGVRVSRQTQPGQRESWGDSCLSRPHGVLSDFGLAWGSAASLLSNHGAGTYQMDGLANLLAEDDGPEAFDRRMAAFEMAMSTLRMAVIDGKDQFSRSTGTLSGVSELLGEFKQLMAAAAEQPVTILMGMSPAGMNATGESDTRSWYATVEKRRNSRYLPRLEQLLRFLMLATAGPTSGKEPEVWSAEFNALWTPSEKEVAEIQKLDMERAKIAIENGVASADDVAESFYKGDTYSGAIRVNWDRREKQAAIDAEAAENLGGDDMEAMGYEEEEVDEDDLDALEAEDDDEDLEWDLETEGEPDPDELAELEAEDPDEDEEDEEDLEDEDERDDGLDGLIRLDKGGGKSKGGGVRRVGGKGYNPFRAADGKFGKGTHKAKSKAAKPKAPKFNAAPHQKKIAKLKAAEAKHRTASLATKQKMVDLKATAKKKTPKQRATLKARFEKLRTKRDAFKAKATEARTARIAESKAMTAARKEYGAAAKAKKEQANQGTAAVKTVKPDAGTKAGGKESSGNAKPGAKGVAKPLETEEFDDLRANYTKSLTKEQHAAALAYSGPAYLDINPALRKGDAPPYTDELSHHNVTLGHLDAAIARSSAPRDMVVHRGVIGPAAFRYYDGLKPGDTFQDNGYISTSASKGKAFPGNVRLAITVRKGQKAAPIPSEIESEREVLLARGSKFKIERREEFKGKDGKIGVLLHVSMED